MNEPSFIRNFIKLDSLTAHDRDHLLAIGISMNNLQKLSEQQFNPPIESDLWGGLPPKSGGHGDQEASLEIHCPFTGKSRKSYHGFCPPISEAIFYMFRGEREFFLIFSGGNNILTGLYDPLYHTLISFMDYTEEIIGGVDNNANHREYNRDVFDKWINLLFAASDRHRDIVGEYIEEKSTAPGIIFGFKNHKSYHVRDEMNLLNFIVENVEHPENISVVCGPHDFFDVTAIYPELNIIKLNNGLEALENKHRDVAWEEAYVDIHHRMFSKMAENRLLPLRSIYRRKFIPDSLKRRILNLSEQRCSDEIKAQIEISKKCSPLIWMTIRNHNREWIGQEEGLAHVLDSLYDVYPDMGVVFDGYEATAELMENIKGNLTQPVKTFSALKCSLFETVVWCRATDFFISAVGDGMIFLAISFAKFGVLHSHQAYAEREYFFPYDDEERSRMPCIGGELIGTGDHFEANYSLEWKLVLEKALIAAECALPKS